MASTTAGRRETEAHREAQARLAAEYAGRTLQLWALLPVDDMGDVEGVWMAAVLPLIREGRSRSQSAANGYMRRFVESELGRMSDPFVPVELSRPAEQLQTAVQVSGPIRFRSQVGRGADPQHAWRTSGVSSASTAMRLVLEAGREEVFQQTAADRRAIGFSRVTAGDPCAFCAMLASRGPVYKSAETAAGSRWSASDDSFKVHDACQCNIEPAYSLEGAWNDRSREFRRMWDESTGEARDAGLIGHGTSSRDALNAFRRRMDGRPVVSDRIRRPARPQSSRGRVPEPSATDLRRIDPATAQRKIAQQEQWAASQGWQVQTDGRRMVGVDDGRRIVWRLDDFGRWVVEDYAAA